MSADKTIPTMVDVYLDGRVVTAPLGSSLLNLLLNVGLVVPTACGGHGQCRLCGVQLQGQLPDPTPTEHAALSPAALASGVRLSCQVKILAPLSVTLFGLPTRSKP